jgi:hypothetical protein
MYRLIPKERITGDLVFIGLILIVGAIVVIITMGILAMVIAIISS